MIKQKKYLALIFIIILTSVNAQGSLNQFDNDGKRHGLWAKNYDGTDLPRYRGQFNHGKEVDTFKYYKIKNEKAVLSAIKVFSPKDNSADVTFLASNGKVVSQGKMLGKLFFGAWVFYHNNSDKIMIRENYNLKGELDGERLVYYKNGNLAEKAVYKNNQLNGVSYWYTEKNNTLRMSSYRNDKLNGPSKYYDALGNLSAEGSYTDDLKTGLWSYFKDGKPEKEINHSN